MEGYALFSGLIILYMFYIIIIAVTMLVNVGFSMWGLAKIFQKSGREFWKIFIPFYNNYNLYDLAWSGKFYWIELGFSIFSLLMTFVGYVINLINPIIYAGQSYESGIYNTFIRYVIFTILSVLFSIGVFIMRIFLYRNLSKAFDGDGWLFAGLIFFGNIFIIYLGLSDQKYIGNVYKNKRVD